MQLPEKVTTFVMISPEEVIYPLVKAKQLIRWNLRTKESHVTTFDFISRNPITFGRTDTFELFFFRESNLLCVKEITM